MHTARIAAAVALLAAPALLAQDSTTTVTKATTDLGYVETSGNTQVTTMSINEKVTHARGRLGLEQSFALVYGEQQGTVNANSLRAGVRGEVKLNEHFSVFSAVTFERNVFNGLKRRFEEQLGLQLRAFAATRDTIHFQGGASVAQQTAVSGVADNFVAARAAAAWRHVFTPASYFEQLIETLPNLTDTEDYRVNTESSLVAPISARVGVKLSYVIRYDNLPEPGFSSTDRLFTTGIQLTFE